MIFSAQHKEMLLLLSCYLPYGIEVHHQMLGTGTLVGLPWAPAWERPRAEVRFHDHEFLQDYDLCEVKPLLIPMTGFDRYVLNTLAAEKGVAEAVDYCRSLQFAVGLKDSQFITKDRPAELKLA
jgi:hypothetical protein